MQTADIMIIKTKAVLEAITITAEELLISIQTGSALMQAVLLVSSGSAGGFLKNPSSSGNQNQTETVVAQVSSCL